MSSAPHFSSPANRPDRITSACEVGRGVSPRRAQDRRVVAELAQASPRRAETATPYLSRQFHRGCRRVRCGGAPLLHGCLYAEAMAQRRNPRLRNTRTWRPAAPAGLRPFGRRPTFARHIASPSRSSRREEALTGPRVRGNHLEPRYLVSYERGRACAGGEGAGRNLEPTTRFKCRRGGVDFFSSLTANFV